MLRAVSTFHASDRTIAAGEYVHDHDDVVVNREHLFESVGALSDVELQVERDAAVAERDAALARLAEVEAERDAALAKAEDATAPTTKRGAKAEA